MTIILLISIIAFSVVVLNKPTWTHHMFIVVFILVLCFGLASISVLSVSYQYASDLTPKIGESITTALINILSNLFGFINLTSITI